MDTDTTNTYRNPVIDDVNGRYTGVQDVKLVYQPFGKTADDGVYDGSLLISMVKSLAGDRVYTPLVFTL